ncbi:Pentatricopeptide repeat-containing protein [Camellia lanceoleosa]|uniref:Pentatricopeptide repeat-containing protein n=1 Tax=Camellia lanceoleosa TaxID=1840588 RepID=A0ACC0HT21_9ERIC|nr:Pentatricopeptide repeat-containing protein [Camellia lanceoleosa]
MEGTLFPNRPSFPIQPTKPTQSNPRLKFNPKTLPLPPQPPAPPSFPLDSLLQHLLYLSSHPPNSTHNPKLIKSLQTSNTHFTTLDVSSDSQDKQPYHHLNNSNFISLPVLENNKQGVVQSADDGALDFLPLRCKFMLNSILQLPVSSLNAFFDSAKFELFEIDLDSRRESQHSIASQLFDEIPIKDYLLDVRAYTTILHAYSRTGKFGRAISLFEHMNEKGLAPTLVTYNVMLDVYGKMGRSWNKILSLLDEMRIRGLEFDEFTCSTVISACGREGLLEEAKCFFANLKSQGYVPGTVSYNSLLQVFGKAGSYSEALSVLKEMEENNCPPDSVTYNELVAAS